MSESVTNPAKFPGRLWSQLGVHFVPRIFEVESYTRLMQLIVVALVIALLLPNAQQLLLAYAPALEKPERPGWFRLRLQWGTGLFLGGAFFWVIQSFYVAAPSPFLYFNF
jgi:hypothetical protein